MRFFAAMTMATCITFLLSTSDDAVAVEQFGFDHTPLGAAQLSNADNKLTVSNIGSSGEDGVRIELPAGYHRWGGIFEDQFSGLTVPADAFMETRVFGGVNGVPDSLMQIGRATSNGSKIVVEVDFSPVGAFSHTIEVFREGMLVGQVFNHTGPAYQVTAMPAGNFSAYDDQGNPNCGSYCPRPPNCPAAVAFEIIGGPELIGDTIVVSQENMTANTQPITSVEVRASGIPSFTFVDEMTVPVPEPATLVGALFGMVMICVRRPRRVPLRTLTNSAAD